MTLRDATDYRFAAGARRLLVRQGEAAGDPLAAARQLADRLPDLLAATDVTVRGPDALPAGGTAAVVTAHLPADPEAGGRERHQYTAFAQFRASRSPRSPSRPTGPTPTRPASSTAW